MAFLERNLEQLTVVQRQLVEQNGSLKKEVAIAERKLIARNERIQSLENLLQDSQEKLTAANHRYVDTPTLPVLFVRFPIVRSIALLTPPSMQIRSTTHGRQRTSRSRKGWVNARSWVISRQSLFRVRRRRLSYCETFARWRRRRATRTKLRRAIESAGAGGGEWIHGKQAEQLVLQSTVILRFGVRL